MSVLNRIFSGLIWQRIVLVSCFILLAAACWYLGPWFGFGDARPLEAIEPRLAVLLSLLVLLVLSWFRLPLFLLLSVLAVMLVWVLGPWLQIVESYPLKGAGPRFVIIAIITLSCLLYGLWRLLRALAVNPRLLDSLVKKKASSIDDVIDKGAINAAISRAVQYLRRVQRTVPLWKRFFGINHTKLPWLLVLGTPGAGKTTMLFSSGQHFPLPEQMSRQGKDNPPTEHCECLFTNDALFLDTAGKYTSESSSSQHEWTNLLHALKKHRPVWGVNGVIIALSVEDILHKDDNSRLDIAANLRSRLDELRQQLGVRFPVYVTITKLDLITGFEAYFRSLTANEREQIWGFTLPWESLNNTTADNLQTTLREELGLLTERLNSAMYVRQQEEYDVNERKRMYALPQDFGLLAKGVTEIVQNIFFASRYDETQYYPVLRGVYFVSSCQHNKIILSNNNTLLQKWRNLLASEKPQTAASIKKQCEEEGLLKENARGKPYFLTDLFRHVVIPDQDLVSHNLQRKSQRRIKNFIGHFATWGMMIWLVMALFTSYHLNSNYLNDFSGKLAKLSKQTANYVKNPTIELLPSLLNATQSLANSDNLDAAHPPVEWRYGLYTGFNISTYSESLYYFFLKRYLLPQLQEKAVQDMNQVIRGSDDDALWLALKHYLMLTDGIKRDIPWLVEKIVSDWERNGDIQAYGDRDNFVRHLNVLLSLPDWLQYGLKPNAELIKTARARLQERQESTRIWQQFKNNLEIEVPSLTLRGMLGAEAPMIFTLNDKKLLQQGIPGIYTRQGWQKYVKKKLQLSLLNLQREDSLIVGKKNGLTNPLALHNSILTLYFQEYGDIWENFLNSVRLITSEGVPVVASQNASMDIALLRTLVSDNSPLRTLLMRTMEETTLLFSTSPVENSLTNQQGTLIEQAKNMKESVDYGERQLIHKHLDNRFRSLRLFVLGAAGEDIQKNDFFQEQGVPLNNVLSLLRDQYTRFVVYNSMNGDNVFTPLGEEAAQLSAQVGTWPEPIRNIISPLLMRSFEKLQKRVVTQNVASIANGPGEICRAQFMGRYPFANSNDEVSLLDFERFFALGGTVDTWFKQNLEDKVDKSRSPWRYKGTKETTGLAFFEQVEHIRNLFFPDKAHQKISFNFDASVLYLSPSVREFVLNMDGNLLKDAHGPALMQHLSWPGRLQTNLINMSFRQDQAAALPDNVWHGQWALMRWLDDAVSIKNEGNDQMLMRWGEGDKSITLAIIGLSRDGKLPHEFLRNFRCPMIS